MKNYRTTFHLLVILLCFVLITSCALRRSEPLKGSFVPASQEIGRGQVLYNFHCQKCHPEGEGGLGPDINWNPAPSFVKKFQVRHGLGVMPSFKKDEISNEELQAIGKYMKAFKHQKRA